MKVVVNKEWLTEVLAEYFKWGFGYKIAGGYNGQFNVFELNTNTDDCQFEIRTWYDSMDYLVSFFRQDDVEYHDFLGLGEEIGEVIITDVRKAVEWLFEEGLLDGDIKTLFKAKEIERLEDGKVALEF